MNVVLVYCREFTWVSVLFFKEWLRRNRSYILRFALWISKNVIGDLGVSSPYKQKVNLFFPWKFMISYFKIHFITFKFKTWKYNKNQRKYNKKQRSRPKYEFPPKNADKSEKNKNLLGKQVCLIFVWTRKTWFQGRFPHPQHLISDISRPISPQKSFFDPWRIKHLLQCVIRHWKRHRIILHRIILCRLRRQNTELIHTE